MAISLEPSHPPLEVDPAGGVRLLGDRDWMAALEAMRSTLPRPVQLQAWLAFMLGESDEEEIQRGLVPTDEADRAPSPSVRLDLR